MHNKRILITAGPTQEPIDPVRYISNHSSGKQGYAIARACVEAGAEEVVLVSGPTQLDVPEGVQLVRVKTADEMLSACEMALPVDVAICAAAVCDWRMADIPLHKMKKQQGQEKLVLELVKNPDILAHLAAHSTRPEVVVGFAAETENHLENAKEKLASKSCDAIAVNDVSVSSGTFGSDDNRLYLLNNGGDGVVDLGRGSKDQLAKALVGQIKESFFS